jgi:hypothetical protein
MSQTLQRRKVAMLAVDEFKQAHLPAFNRALIGQLSNRHAA